MKFKGGDYVCYEPENNPLVLLHEDLFSSTIDYLVSNLSSLNIEEDDLIEAKSIGTITDIPAMRGVLATAGRSMDPVTYNKNISNKTSNTKKVFDKYLASFESDLIKIINGIISGSISKNQASISVRNLLRTGYFKAYALGLNASGVSQVSIGGKIPQLNQQDIKFIESAFRHEMRFMNNFVNQLVNNTHKMNPILRSKMYARALMNMYDNGRLQGLPNGILIFWHTSSDKKVCPGCDYLKRNAPYSKFNIPTFPRSGMTQCLTNCRCRTTVKYVTQEKLSDVLQKSRSKSTHLKYLQKLKKK